MTDDGGHSRRLDRLCRRAGRPVYVVRRDGRIVMANPALLAWLDRSAGEVVGRIAADTPPAWRAPPARRPPGEADALSPGTGAAPPAVRFPSLPEAGTPTAPSASTPTVPVPIGLPSGDGPAGLRPPASVFDGVPARFVARAEPPAVPDADAASTPADEGRAAPWRWAWAVPLTSGRASATALVVVEDRDGSDLTEAAGPGETFDVAETPGGPATPPGDDPAARAIRDRPAPVDRDREASRAGGTSWLTAGSSDAARLLRARCRLAESSASDLLAVGPAGSRGEELLRDVAAAGSIPVLAVLRCDRLDDGTAAAAIRQAVALAADLGRGERRWAILLTDLDAADGVTQRALSRAIESARPTPRLLVTARSAPGAATASRDVPDIPATDRPGLSAAWAARLGVLVLPLAALTARPGDIPALAQALLDAWRGRGESTVTGLSQGARERLERAPWPGDAAELLDTLRQAVRRCDGPTLAESHLPPAFLDREAAERHRPPPREEVRLPELLDAVEREAIRRALIATDGNRSAAAERLGIHRGRLLRRIEQLGLDDGGAGGGVDFGDLTTGPTPTGPDPTAAAVPPPGRAAAKPEGPAPRPSDEAAKSRRAARRGHLPPLPPAPTPTKAGPPATSPPKGPPRGVPGPIADGAEGGEEILPSDAFVPVDEEDDESGP